MLGIGAFKRGLRCVVAAVVVLGAGALTDHAAAQTCSTGGSFVSVTDGTACSIPSNTTLNGNAPVAGNPVIYSTNPGSAVTTTNVTVSPFNGGSTGGLATNNGTIIFSAGSTIQGNWAIAAWVQSGGIITFQAGSTINAPFGGGGTILLADGATSQIIANGLTANISGSGANTGVHAQNGGSIELNSGTTITFQQGGGSNVGLLASGVGSSITTNNATINIPLVGNVGGNDTGARAEGGASIELNGGSIAVHSNGGGETGLIATGTDSSITGNGVTVDVTSNGANARGGLLQNGGEISLTGGSVTTSGGGGSFGFLFQGADTQLTLNGTNVSSASDAFSVDGGASTVIDTTGATVIGNNGILMNVAGGGSVTMTSDSSTLTGAITTAGSSDVTLENGTVWNMTASSTITNLINNNSNIISTAPGATPSYKTLTVASYDGTGGTITFNTFLGTDEAPSDLLIVNGTATGLTNVAIRNTNGPGEQTLLDGIQVVSATGSTDGAFQLAGAVRGGAYDYRLYQGGLLGGSPNDWFLRSTFISPPGPPPDPPPGPVVPPTTLPAFPPEFDLPPGTYPITGPGIPVYSVGQPLARELGLATLGTLNQRIGDTLTLANAGNEIEGKDRSDWIRVFGQTNNAHYQSFADPRTSGWLGGLQFGRDYWRETSESGRRDANGFYLAFTHSFADVDGLVTNEEATGYELVRAGAIDLNAFSAAAYWTRYAASGWYVDAVVQGSLYGGNAITPVATLPLIGYGLIGSLETGYPIRLGGPDFVLEPQAQIIWQGVGFDQTNDLLGDVALGTTSGLTGRIGLRGQWTHLDAHGTLWQPYAGVNLWSDFGTDAVTLYDGTDMVPLLADTTRLELLAGTTARLSTHTSLYAEGSYQFAVAGLRRDTIKADFGVRRVW